MPENLRNLKVTVDGSCSKSRQTHVGFIIRDADTGEILEQGSKYMGRGTSNTAEYNAIIYGCERAALHEPKSIIIFTDSQLVVRQLKGEYRTTPRLRHLRTATVCILTEHKVKLVWHRRDEDDGPLADALATGRAKQEGQSDAEIQNYMVAG